VNDLDKLKEELNEIHDRFFFHDEDDQDKNQSDLIIKKLLDTNLILIDKIKQIPDWIFNSVNRCCPPGESCCYCD